MTRQFFKSGLAAVLLWAVAGQSQAQAPSDGLPEAPGKAVVVAGCSTCHSVTEVMTKRRTADEWDEVVGKMIDRGANLTDDQQDKIIAYLAANFGPAPPAAAAAAPAK